MRRNRAIPTLKYTVWYGGRTRQGSAKEILQAIQADALPESSIKKLSVEEYADSLINSAPSHVPKQAMKFLQKREYDSKFDQALRYFDAMLSSGVRILAGK
jgi:hypothetical protein